MIGASTTKTVIRDGQPVQADIEDQDVGTEDEKPVVIEGNIGKALKYGYAVRGTRKIKIKGQEIVRLAKTRETEQQQLDLRVDFVTKSVTEVQKKTGQEVMNVVAEQMASYANKLQRKKPAKHRKKKSSTIVKRTAMELLACGLSLNMTADILGVGMSCLYAWLRGLNWSNDLDANKKYIELANKALDSKSIEHSNARSYMHVELPTSAYAKDKLFRACVRILSRNQVLNKTRFCAFTGMSSKFVAYNIVDRDLKENRHEDAIAPEA